MAGFYSTRTPLIAVALTVGLAAGAMSAPQTEAAGFIDVAGVRFDSEIRRPGEHLELRGAALLRWRGLFRAYVAALYLPPETAPEDVLANGSKRLEIEYFRAIRAEALGRAAEDLLGRTVSSETLAAIRSRLDELHRAYESIEPGDRYALDYRPGTGTELSKNGRPLVVIPGADFAAAYFSIWLGENPIDAGLRDSLLGTLPMRAQE